MKKFPLFLSVPLFFSHGALYSGDFAFHGSAKNSIYSYDSDKAHTRVYQYARLNVESPDRRINANLSARAMTDLNSTLSDDLRFKAYSFNVGINDIFQHRLNLTLGRQFLHPGAVLGALDGIHARLKMSDKMSLQLYSGLESPYLRDTELNRDRFVVGGLMQLKNIASSRLQLLYLQKSDNGEILWQLTGFNLDNSLLHRTNLRIQSHYDIQNDRMHRLLISARHSLSESLAMFAALTRQCPQIYANSIYTIFEPDAYTQYRAGAAVRLLSDLYLNGEFQLIQFTEENASKIFINLSNKNGSLGLAYESGYIGDQLSLMFDCNIELLPELIASVYVDYSRYRTETIYEYDNQLANAARLSYRFNRHLSIDAEYQWLTNRYKQSDSRFLNHIAFRW